MKFVNCQLSIVNCCSFAAVISFILFIYSFEYISLDRLLTGQAIAETMRNNQYTIQGNLNSISGKATGGGKTLTSTSGQTAVGLYSGANYKVRAGFQYVHSIIPFSFSISNTEINFGTLTAGEAVTRTTNLTISNGSASGYQVTVSEDHPLRSLTSGVDIPDTTCDSGICSEITASEWSNPLTYGFGYRCNNVSGTDCQSFSANFYKQFANREANETDQVIMTGKNVGRNKQIQVTYKVNISSTQPAGTYQNTTRYIATPTI